MSGQQGQGDEAILRVDNLSLAFGGLRALSEVSFTVQQGELFSIIGPNGAGKTSILNCLSGRYRPQSGTALCRDKNGKEFDLLRQPTSARARLGVARTFQNLALFQQMSVLDNILVGAHHLLKRNFLYGMAYWLGGAQKEEMAMRRDVEDIIDFLELQSYRHTPAGALPYGARKRVELARAIAGKPRLLLLDEPMAGMNLDEKEDMARFVVDLNEEQSMTIIMIEHDMGVVADISERVLALDFGQVIACATPAEIVNHDAVKQAYLGITA